MPIVPGALVILKERVGELEPGKYVVVDQDKGKLIMLMADENGGGVVLTLRNIAIRIQWRW